MAERPTRTRHVVLWLTVLVYMITYMDRVVMGAAAPSIREEFEISDIMLGYIISAFQLSYALFQVPGGWLGDKYGPRKVLSGIVIWWSAFTAATAMMWSAQSIIVARFLFGMGEAGAFPNATRSLSRWMLPSERGWAQGVTHAGARLGAALTPILVVAMIAAWGWRAPFFVFSTLGVAWAILWYWYYRDTPREHSGVNELELRLIEDSLGQGGVRVKRNVPWSLILKHREMWTLSAMYACYGYGLVIFTTWFFTYLTQEHGLSRTEMGILGSMPLAAGVIGDLLGGFVSDHWYKRTGNLKMARRWVAVFGFILAGVTIPIAVLSPNPLVGVAWFCLAFFGFELTVGVWAVTLDLGHEFAGSVSAVMNTFGNLGGVAGGIVTGYIVEYYGWTEAFFVVGGLAILAALLFMRIDASQRLYIDVPEGAAPA